MHWYSVLFTIIAHIAVFTLSAILLSAYFKLDVPGMVIRWSMRDTLACAASITFLFFYFT